MKISGTLTAFIFRRWSRMTIRELASSHVAALLAATDLTRERARDRAIVALCLDAGLRRGEIEDLCVRDLDHLNAVLTVADGGRRRLVRLGSTALAAVAPFVDDRPLGSPLLVSRSGRPASEREVHEQLLRVGELAGFGAWVTNRHTRRVFLSAVGRQHGVSIAMRLVGHVGGRVRPATCEEALHAQQRRDWVSPMDWMVGSTPPSTLASDTGVSFGLVESDDYGDELTNCNTPGGAPKAANTPPLTEGVRRQR
jgi:integrase